MAKRYQERAALRDGWGLWANSDYGLRIERYDEARRFPSDLGAVEHVIRAATVGGANETAALEAIATHYGIEPGAALRMLAAIFGLWHPDTWKDRKPVEKAEA